jgi:ribose transport system ATP-binding protein
MLEELLRIENGVAVQNGHELIKGLYLQVYKGEILGLVSDNITEKQYILDILNGKISLDYGKIFMDEKRITENVAGVFRNKIAVIESKSKLVDNLTVAENIFVVRGGFKKYFVNKKLLYRQTSGLLSEFHMTINPKNYAGRLDAIERCMVELVKAYATGHRLIVCSDFTSFLSSMDVKKIISLLIWLKKKGIGFIMIENYDNVLFEYSDRLAIINHGKTSRIFDKEDIEKDKIYTLLIGDEQDTFKGYKQSSNRMNEKALNNFAFWEQVRYLQKSEEIMLEIKKITTEILHDFSLQIRKGEILNILYQDVASKNELVQLLSGEVKKLSGRMMLDSKDYEPLGWWDAIKKGVCFIDEDPISNMIFYDMSVMDNLCFTMANKVKKLWLHRRYKKSIFRNMESFFSKDILRTPISKLEPINLIKIAYVKWLLYLPKIIVCIKPFSAVDVHMKQVTEQLIQTFLSKGISVIIITSNIAEAHVLGGKVLVLKEGKIVNENI